MSKIVTQAKWQTNLTIKSTNLNIFNSVVMISVELRPFWPIWPSWLPYSLPDSSLRTICVLLITLSNPKHWNPQFQANIKVSPVLREMVTLKGTFFEISENKNLGLYIISVKFLQNKIYKSWICAFVKYQNEGLGDIGHFL